MSSPPQPTQAPTPDPHFPTTAHELWRLHGASDPLRGLAVETSFGYALALELAGEVVLLHLQPSLEVLVAYAERIEVGLRAQGWRTAASSSLSEEEPV